MRHEIVHADFNAPFLVAAWERVLMIHFEVDAEALQREAPYELDLLNGRAFVTLVAFTLRGMKPSVGGRLGEWLFRPIATHDFLNVRTYVRHQGETGIHFLAEWLTSKLAVRLGPPTFGLPYRHGRIEYQHDWERGEFRGQLKDVASGASLSYEGRLDQSDALRPGTGRAPQFAPCESGSLDEWLLERYVAFNSAGNCRRFFRVWHPPWAQCPVNVELCNISLLTQNWRWFRGARLIGANFSPGIHEVWMGRPHFLRGWSSRFSVLPKQAEA